MPTAHAIILASRSPYRRRILESAGISVQARPASIDETAMIEQLRAAGSSGPHVAEQLAMAKAGAVCPGSGARAVVIGSDQVLEVDGVFHETEKDPGIAKARLLSWAGRAHWLHTGLALRIDGSEDLVISETVEVRLAPFSQRGVDAYAEVAGDALTTTAGGYAIEGVGAQLIDRIEGDYFAALGLPLWPLLNRLRALDLIIT